MKRRQPLAAIVVAMVASVGLMTAAGCGSDDAEDTGDAIESVATGATGAAPDDSGAAPTDGSTGAATAPGDGGTAPAGGEELEIPAAEQGLAYQVTEVSAAAGQVTLRMPNPSAIPHNIAVDEPEQQLGEVVEQGGESEISLDFPAGDYEYYCSVPGHREAGMVGTLTVE
jgi:plastocyanin